MVIQLISTASWVVGDHEVMLTTIPADLKRRCSRLSKISLELANRAICLHEVDYAIFCSRHGEIRCATELLKDICSHNILSPAKFSRSVHNTVAGLFCIINNLQINTVSISACDNTFLMGMLEVFAWLKLNSEKTAILVMFDEYIPEEFNVLNIKNNPEYVAVFLLTNKVKVADEKFPCISFSIEPKNGFGPVMTPMALEFLQWYLGSMAKELIQETDSYAVKWYKTNV